MSGKMVKADRLKTAYFAQHQLDELKPEQSPYDHMRALMPDAAEAQCARARRHHRFSGQAADAAVKTLSGGEKARAAARACDLRRTPSARPRRADQPPRHRQPRRADRGDQRVSRAVILVSHDRYLLEACADRLWHVAGGAVTPFDGDIDDYRRTILSGGDQQRGDDASPRPRRARRNPACRRRKAAEFAPLQRQIKKAEADIARHSQRIADIDAILADPQLYVRDAARAAALNKERAEVATALSAAEETWLALSGEYETAMAD